MQSIYVKETTVVIRVEGGTADEGLIPIYDAARMKEGIARAINISTHAFANSDQIRKHGEKAVGAEIFSAPAKKGCFEEIVEIRFLPAVLEQISKTSIIDSYWDYLAFAWSSAIGKKYNPSSLDLNRRIKRNELLSDELGEALESSILNIHRPLKTNCITTIDLVRPRVSDILRFDVESLNYVTPHIDESNKLKIIGAVTKFNRLSGIGRIYTQSDNKTVAFSMHDPRNSNLMARIARSLSLGTTDGNSGFMKFIVTSVFSGGNHFKRYIIHDALQE